MSGEASWRDVWVTPDLSKLREPFPEKDIEWRVQQADTNKAGKLWARVLAYVTSRAVMARLDEVVGPERWQDRYESGPQGGVVCGISILTAHGWVTKWDGADNTDIEGVKGGLSGAFKRAAVKWGIGRYLYELEAGFANIHPGGTNYVGKGKHGDAFKWDPPRLPGWAVPGDSQASRADPPGERPAETQAKAPPAPVSPPVSRGELGQAMRRCTKRAELEALGARIKKLVDAGDITPADKEALGRVYGECILEIAEAERIDRGEA